MTDNGNGKDDSRNKWFKSYKDNVVQFPTKEKKSVIELGYVGLEALEREAVEQFPNEEDPRGLLHMTLLGALPFMMLCNGWEKEEILECFSEQLEDSKDLFDELEESDE